MQNTKTTIKLIIITGIAPLFMIGCASGGSMGAYGPGADSARIGASRGLREAQISKAQGDQYTRQREQVRDERKLEEENRQSILGGLNDYVHFGQGLMQNVRQFVH